MARSTLSGPLFDESTPHEALAILVAGVRAAGERLRTGVVERTPVDTGLLRNSVRVDPVAIEGELLSTVVGTPLVWAPAVELGRRPKQPGPPYDPILEWTRRNRGKLGVEFDEIESVAFAIRNKIHEEGSPGHTMFERAFKEVGPLAEQDMRQAVDVYVQRWNR